MKYIEVKLMKILDKGMPRCCYLDTINGQSKWVGWQGEKLCRSENITKNLQWTSPKAKNNFYLDFFALRSLCWRDTIFEHATNFLSFISTQREKRKKKKHEVKLNFYTHLFLLCFKTINKIR